MGRKGTPCTQSVAQNVPPPEIGNLHGNGIPVPMVIHGNGSSFWATNGNGIGIGNNVMGMRVAHM